MKDQRGKFKFLNEGFDLLILSLIVICYSVLFTYLSFLRFENFYTSNWDLGINQQLLWTTTHGYLMYESGDFVFTGVLSFLQVHSAYIAFLVAGIYYFEPSVFTLFFLQAVVLSLSSFPLYFIAKKVMAKKLIVYLIIFAFLFNFSIAK